MSDDFDKSDGDRYGILAALNRATHIDDELQSEKEARANDLADILAQRIGERAESHLQQALVDGESTCSFLLSLMFPKAAEQTNGYLALALFIDPTVQHEIDFSLRAWRTNIIFLYRKNALAGRTSYHQPEYIESILMDTPIEIFSGAGSDLPLTLGEVLSVTESLLDSGTENQVKHSIDIDVKILPEMNNLQPLLDVLQSPASVLRERGGLPIPTENTRHPLELREVRDWIELHNVKYCEVHLSVSIDFSKYLNPEETEE